MHHNLKFAPRLCAFFLVLVFVLALVPARAAAVSQDEIDELNEEIARLEEEKEEYARLIESLADDISTVLERKLIIDSQIAATEEQIDAIETIISFYEAEIGGLETEIETAQEDLADARAAADETYDLYCERVRALEEAGMVSYWGIIFGADSFADMLTRVDFISEVITYNEQIITSYNELCSQIEAHQAELEVHLSEKQDVINANQAAREELLLRTEELNQQRILANELMLEINSNRDLYEDIIAQLEAEEELIHQQIAEMEAQLEYQRRLAAARAAAEAARKKAEEEARKKAEAEAEANRNNGNTGDSTLGDATITPDTGNGDSGGDSGDSGDSTLGDATIQPGTGGDSGGGSSGGGDSGGSGGDSGSGDSGSTGDGSTGSWGGSEEPEIDYDEVLSPYTGYIWPVPSRTINSYFGYRSAEETGGIGSTYHRGIDIGRVYYSTTVVASKAGYVSIATYSSSYGNYVVIDHGDGSKTLYAHMSSLSVSAGQYVSQGQAIGVTGSTGNSTGPHLHFEIIIHGSNVDPLGYLP